MIKICQQCNEEYKTYKSKSKYCSSKCTGESQSKKIIKTCEFCGDEFKTHNYRRDSARFCSEDCRAKAEYKIGFDGENKICTKCGILKPLSEFNKNRPSCKDCLKEQRKKYYEKNKEVFKKHARNREKLLQMLPKTLTPEQWGKTLEFFGHACSYCGSDKVSQEHLIPISKGGGFVKNNIIPACESCNKSKRDHNFLDWYPEQYFFDEIRAEKIIAFVKENTEGRPSGNRS